MNITHSMNKEQQNYYKQNRSDIDAVKFKSKNKNKNKYNNKNYSNDDMLYSSNIN